MTRYFVTAWCDRPFYAQCEVEADTPEEALAKARETIHDAPAEECDEGYYWDEWRVDTDKAEGVLLHLDEPARLQAAARKLLVALQAIVQEADNISYHTPLWKDFWGDARAAIAEATGGTPNLAAPDPREALLLAASYIQYVKERNPGLHSEADGTPSIEQAVAQATGRAA